MISPEPYEESSRRANRRSAVLTDDPDRAPARAMLKGTGLTDADLARPLIGVSTHRIESMPCNLNHRELAGYVKKGIRAGGGTAIEFNTIAISDGVSMGTEGMRASLVSREVIADSIELVVRGHMLDGLVFALRDVGREVVREHQPDVVVHRERVQLCPREA